MQALYAENFDREFDCSEKQWLGMLPGAMGAHPYQLMDHALSARIGSGQLVLSRRAAATRGGAQRRVAGLLVSFRFSGLDEAQRYVFMQRFDLCTAPDRAR